MATSKVVKKEASKKVAVKKTVAVKAKAVKVEKVEAEVKAVKTVGLSVPMFDVKGAKEGTFSLPKEVFGVKINEALMAQAVRVYLANQRLGTAVTQTRGEVTGSTKKIYRQKGTGGARHGGKRAPIFVKGGVAHGPKLRDYSLSMPQKMKKAALLSALSQRAKDGDIKVLSGLTKVEAKTKNMHQLISRVTEDKKGKGRVLLVTSANPKELSNVYQAGRNIKNVEIINAKLLNTYEVLKHKNLLFMKESVEVLVGGSK
jgi:large subunit ribosomal protein L4